MDEVPGTYSSSAAETYARKGRFAQLKNNSVYRRVRVTLPKVRDRDGESAVMEETRETVADENSGGIVKDY